MEQSKPLEEIDVWNPSTSIRDSPDRGVEQEVFREESGGLSSPSPQQSDSTQDDAEAKNDFWSITGEIIYRHQRETRVKLYIPTEESFPISLKYIDVTRTTHTLLDVLLEKHIDDYWNVDGERELSDARTGFTRFILLNERPPDGFSWSWRRRLRKQTTSRPDKAWPDMWKHMSVAAKSKAKQKWAIREPKYVVSSTLNRMMKNSSIPWKNPRRRLEVPMPATKPCKTPVSCRGGTCRSIGKTGPNMLVLSKLTNLWEYEKKVYRKGITKMTSLQKESNHKDITIWHIENIQAWQLTSQKQERSDQRNKE